MSTDLAMSLLGWCTPEKAQAMADLILQEEPLLCVEIGVFGGRSLVAQALALREVAGKSGQNGVIWGIDPWTTDAALEGENGNENDEWWAKQNLAQIRNGLLAAIDDNDLWNWVRIAVAKSADLDQSFWDIDILHIDGNHSEECSTSDVKIWLPAVRPGGWIWFDDTNWKSTSKAVRMLDKACKVVKDVGACRLYRKHD